jgi:hypothetical protein
MREELWGELPDLPAVSIATLEVPPDVLAAIRQKNWRLLHQKVSFDELTAPDSPYVLDTYFDDQLWEVLCAIAAKYDPISFIDQAAQMIESFWNRSAAFLPSAIVGRIGPENATACVTRLYKAWREASEPESKRLMELLVTDLSFGGASSWVTALDEKLQAFVRQSAARSGA